jgi:hypothetical protein
MSHYHGPCAPPFHPSPGDEDIERLSSTASRVFYVVGVGYTRGIYTNEQVVSGLSPFVEYSSSIFLFKCHRQGPGEQILGRQMEKGFDL